MDWLYLPANWLHPPADEANPSADEASPPVDEANLPTDEASPIGLFSMWALLPTGLLRLPLQCLSVYLV